MDIQDWLLSTLLSSAVSVFLVAVLGWLFKSLIEHRLKASVQHEFDDKLETLRADLRKSEETFKADLRAKEAQIAALQSGALMVLASRQAALDKRRLKAIEQVWEGVEVLRPMKWAAGIMRNIHFKRSLEEASKNQKTRDFFSTLGQGFTPDKFPKTDAHKARPFVSEIAWALFYAYQSILSYSCMQLHMLKNGINQPDLLKSDDIPKLVKASLPYFAKYIDENGIHGCYFLVDDLESEILKELQRMTRGEDSDHKTIEQAAKIMEAAKTLNESLSKNNPASASVSPSQ